MAIISKNVSNYQYTDQHKPIQIDWTSRNFKFLDDYVVSVNKDLNSQLLEFECDNSYDGVDLYGTNVYINYLTDWTLDGKNYSQGSILLDNSREEPTDNILRIQWILDHLQTYRAGEIQFALTFQMEQEFDSQYYVSWKDSSNQEWAANTWFKVINPAAEKASWILALIQDINDFERIKATEANGIPICITIGDNTTDALYEQITTQPLDWAANYKLYYTKNTTYSLNTSETFNESNCYKRKYIGLMYQPLYVLKTLIGKFSVIDGLDVNSTQYIPTTSAGEIDEEQLANKTYVAEQISEAKTEIESEITSTSTTLDTKINTSVSSLETRINTISTNLANTISTVNDTLSGRISTLETTVNTRLIDMVYPVGSIYISVNNVSPQVFWGGVWTALGGQFLLGANTTYPAGTTGGEATHTLTTSEIPSHTHNIKFGGGDAEQTIVAGRSYVQSTRWWWSDASDAIVQSSGGGSAHNNMPPYLSVYMWKRTS